MNFIVSVLRFILLVFVCSEFLAFPALAWKPDYVPPPGQLKQLEKENDKRRAELNTTALLFGKVMDFSGRPVAGAVVTMRLSAVPNSILDNDQRLVTTVTDSAGTFQLEETGFMFYLVRIECNGYQFKMEYNKNRSLEFRSKVKASGKGYEPDKPMVFKMRKKATPSFVLIGNWAFGLRAGEAKLLDLYRREWASPDRLAGKKINYPDWQADVKVSVDEDGENFRLIVEALDADSGFVVESPEFFEEMTEAPEQGYRSKLVIPIVKGKGGRLFIYVKSSGGLFYSKMLIKYFTSADRNHVGLRCSYRTNVAGERGLGYDDSLYRQYINDEKEGRRSQVRREQLLNGETVAPPVEARQ